MELERRSHPTAPRDGARNGPADSATPRRLFSGSPKRSYRPPRIVERQPLGALAATCVSPGSKPDPVTCPAGPIQS
ncbi:MAG: hypothetical protein AAGN66_16730 [Acidobacteriota bacterium]